jgi:1-acyl-sn-glycerol-3-phosphate acyltransferase
MKQRICRFIYHQVLGWTEKVSVPDFDKYIICAAPHTTNWDLFIGKLFIGAIGRKAGFLMKKEWFFFPLGVFFRWIGGIPVNRDKHSSMVEQIIYKIKNSQTFHLAITPEGTRSPNPNWKKGFYYIALGANIPIVLIGIDYKKKCIYAEKYIIPCGDINKDMKTIKLYFKQFKGKYPEKFDIGNI